MFPVTRKLPDAPVGRAVLTLSVTPTLTGELEIPEVVLATTIVSVCASNVWPEQFAETITLPAAEPLVGERVSQLDDFVAEKLSRMVLAAPIARLWLAGFIPPDSQLNVKLLGATVSTAKLATVRFMVTVWGEFVIPPVVLPMLMVSLYEPAARATQLTATPIVPAALPFADDRVTQGCSFVALQLSSVTPDAPTVTF